MTEGAGSLGGVGPKRAPGFCHLIAPSAVEIAGKVMSQFHELVIYHVFRVLSTFVFAFV